MSLWRQIDVRSYLECGLTGRDKALDGHSVDAPDTAAADAVAYTIFRKSRRLSLIDMAKTPLRINRGGLTLDIAFRPHLPFGKTTLHKRQVGGGRQPSLVTS